MPRGVTGSLGNLSQIRFTITADFQVKIIPKDILFKALKDCCLFLTRMILITFMRAKTTGTKLYFTILKLLFILQQLQNSIKRLQDFIRSVHYSIKTYTHLHP